MSELEQRPERPALSARREVLAVAAILVAVTGYLAVGRLRRALAPTPTSTECTKLVDWHLEQATRQRHPSADAVSIARMLASVRVSPERLSDVARCKAELTAAQVRCGLSAHNVDEIERCMQ